ncbi:hypothetical protein LV89_00939 [Arcicella aurantiaca]|uniref:Uncharacterized protein n=1 Tax=Arcicella aurantiaca TaxID=591202 RepID=A0A316ECF8_9BACT|nr:hypothetical protein [Arcicella aurantiaca]PWK28161.1 hypothetical protein LV89_00939 [Arcicella aurantiaca]
MKKISFLFLAIIVALMTSCGITPDVQPVTDDLTLPLADGTLDIAFTDSLTNKTGTVTAASGDNVNVSLIIKKTPTGEKPRIMRIFITDKANYRGKTDQPLFEIKLKNIDEQTQTIDYTVSPTSGKVYIHCDVYDNKDKVTRKTLIVNIASEAQIASWQNVTLGAQSNAAASRLASATGDLYKVCDLDSNIRYVDITYAALGSPSVKPTFLSNPRRAALGLSTTIPTSNTVCGGGSTAGGLATYFVLAPTTVDFVTANDAILGGLTIPATAQDIVAEVGKTYAFLNGRNKKGLIKVTKITAGTTDFNGTITFDLKVQK